MPNQQLKERRLPRAQQIARCMSSLGFTPRPLQDPNFVEYTKDYAEPGGKIGRLSVFFTKDSFLSAMDSSKLGKFRITIQGQLDPVPELVEEQAPGPMKPDMLRMLESLEGLYLPQNAPEEVECDICGMLLAEYVTGDDGRIHCSRPDLCELERGSHSNAPRNVRAGRSDSGPGSAGGHENDSGREHSRELDVQDLEGA